MPGDGGIDPGGGKPPNIQNDGNNMEVENTSVQNTNTIISTDGKNTSSDGNVANPSAQKQTVLYKAGMRCDTYKLIVQLKPNAAPVVSENGKRPYRYIRGLILSKLVAEITNKSPDILEIRRLNRGKFLIVCATSKCANMIVENEKMKEQFMAFIPVNYVSRAAIIRDVDLEITDDELRDNIETGDFKITYIQRMNRKTITDGKVTYVPSSTVKLVFEGQDMPQFIYLWYCRLPCEPFIQNPIQCFSCFRYGHITKFCKNKKLCNKCYQEEDVNHECDLVQPKCLNCGGMHNSNSKSCPEYERQRSIKILMSTRCLCFPEANAVIPRERESYAVHTKNSFAALESVGNEDSSNGNYSNFNAFPELKSNQPRKPRSIDRYVPPPLSTINRASKRKPDQYNIQNRDKISNQNKKNKNMFDAMSQITKPETYYKGNEISQMMYKGCENNKIDKTNDENRKWLNLNQPDIQFSGYSTSTNNNNDPGTSYSNGFPSMILNNNNNSNNQQNNVNMDMVYQMHGSPHMGY